MKKTVKILLTVLVMTVASVFVFGISALAADYPESVHDYYNNCDDTWTYIDEDTNAKFLLITFSSSTYVETKYDWIYIYDLNDQELGAYSGSDLAGATISVPGYGFKIRMVTDGSNSGYGFRVENVVAQNTIPITYCNATVVGSVVYNGRAQAPGVSVKYGNITLVKNVDYTVSYGNNKNVGKGTVTITGKGDYQGSMSGTFNITALKISDKSISTVLSKTTVTYNGKKQEPAVTVKYGSTVLRKNTDYTVSYKNNIKAGKATVTVTGKGNFTGTVTKNFTIQKKAISSKGFTAKLSKTSVTYNGSAQKPTVTLKDGSKTLKKNTDYTVAYSKNKNAGKAKVTITGKGNYSGKITKTFTIKKLSLKKTKVTKISAKTYTGKAIKPKITVKSGSKKISSANYKVTYTNNKKVGTATVTIKAKGSNTSGSIKTTFKINPKLSYTKKNMFTGKSFTLKLNGVSANKVKFSSSKTSVCTVSSKGVVKAIKAGSATITAKYAGTSYKCSVTVLETSSSSSSDDVKYYQNHDDVPDFGALLKIEPTSSSRSESSGDYFVYSLEDLQKVDPDKEAGTKYQKLLVKCNFKKKDTVTIDGKSYYKYVSEKKIVYFGIASKNGEVKIIVEKV